MTWRLIDRVCEGEESPGTLYMFIYILLYLGSLYTYVPLYGYLCYYTPLSVITASPILFRNPLSILHCSEYPLSLSYPLLLLLSSALHYSTYTYNKKTIELLPYCLYTYLLTYLLTYPPSIHCQHIPKLISPSTLLLPTDINNRN